MMSAVPVSRQRAAEPALCLGEAIVDLICERPAAGFAGADRFEPHLGGVSANIAVFAARAGVPVAIAGAVGGDRWGRWLGDRLRSERVDLTLLTAHEHERTQLAFVALDHAGEPEYRLYPGAAPPLAGLTKARLAEAIARCGALLITSNTLSEPDQRRLTLHARACALARGIPVVVDCNLRLHRWPSEQAAVAAVRECLGDARLVRANRAEATAITGERDPERAAGELTRLGAQLAIVTLGVDGVIVRAEDGRAFSARVSPVPVRSAIGAGDAFTGTLLAAVVSGGAGDDDRLRGAVPAAIGAAGEACQRWGACD